MTFDSFTIHNYTLYRLSYLTSVRLKPNELTRAPPSPGPNYVQIDQFWIKKGDEPVIEDTSYILTKETHTIKRHLNDLARIAVTGKYPVLLQVSTQNTIAILCVFIL